MKNILNAILLIVIAILIYLLLQKDSLISSQINRQAQLQHTYDSSQKIIDSLHERISDNEYVIHSLDNVNGALTDQYQSKKGEIARLTQSVNKPILVVNSYNLKQLDSAFAARYPTDTIKTDSIVTLQKSIGMKSLADLIRYDTLTKVIPMYQYTDSILNLRLVNRDSVITIQNKSIKDYNQMIANYSNQREVLINQRNDADKALKKSKRKNFVTSAAAAVITILYILK